ncbi:MAG TPA: bacteriocin fulvocin C-related protein, partial [Thermoanaerobaculia bacterium]
RDVVYQALGVLATGIFAIDRSSPRWQTDVEAPLSRTIARAKLVMPRNLVAAAFYTLSDDNGLAASPVSRGALRIGVNAVDCECSTQDSWCPEPLVCQGRRPGAFCTPVPSYNCGPFFTFACDGMCV